MKRLKKITFLALASMAFSAISCNTGNNPSTPENKVSAVSVDYNDFSGGSNLILDFESGDRIGVFAVKDNAVDPQFSNLCLTASEKGDGTLEWIADNPEVTLSKDDVKYFAYYPYSESLEGDINPGAQDSKEFFKDIISGIKNTADQSSKELLKKAMFMSASGTLSGDTLVFDMNHNMSLAVFEMPVTIYQFDNTDRKFSDYINTMGASFEQITPFSNSKKTSVYIYNPENAMTVSGKFTNYDCEEEEWECTLNGGQEGSIETYKIGGGNITVNHTLSIGDFFLANGNLLSKDADKSEVQNEHVIGIVFQTNPARIGQTEKDAVGGNAHGLVMAVRHTKGVADIPYRRWFMIRETEEFIRDETEIGLKEIFVPEDAPATFRLADEDISGYDNCLLIRSKRQSDYDNNYYPSIRAALEFDEEIGAPHSNANVSEWFLPANGQWFDILRGLCGVTLEVNDKFFPREEDFYWIDCGNIPELLNARMEKVADSQKDLFIVGDPFWTSSIATNQYAREINIADNYLANSLQLKLNGAVVRPVLVF